MHVRAPVHLKSVRARVCRCACVGGCERLQRGRQPQGAETERIQKTLSLFLCQDESLRSGVKNKYGNVGADRENTQI